MKPLVLDLFAGTGGATAPFLAAGWDVVRVELDESFEAEFHADLREWAWTGRRPSLIWASPPCTEFSREKMPWCRTGKPPSLELVRAAMRVIQECNPPFWCIENVCGSSRWLVPLLGEPLCLGPVRLYGNFPPFTCIVPPWKERLSSSNKKERARIPSQIGEGLRLAIEGSLFWHGELSNGSRQDTAVVP